GSETNCIPLSHFRRLFPTLVNTDGRPKDSALQPTLAQFEAYDGGILQAHGWIIVPTQNISDKKFHPVRYYVVEREEARILISHATVTWLGLVKVLCNNKAPKIKRQVASLKTKSDRIGNKTTLSGPSHPPKEKYSLSGPSHPPKVKYFSQKDGLSAVLSGPAHPPKVKYSLTASKSAPNDKQPTTKPHRRRSKQRKGKPVHREEEVHKEHQPTETQVSETNSNLGRRVQTSGKTELAGPAHPPKVKYTQNCQNVSTISHRRTKKLSTSILRAISSVTKTHRRQ
ncbi:MAG: hypothetical protein MJE68_16640, partial [Proteobacteria bacterium]|nr:hypothetical protein [Pseudomonadota bacterium]